MKKFLLLLSLMPMLVFGSISADKEYKLNRYMGPVAAEVGLGTLLKQGGSTDVGRDGVEPKKVLRVTYDYAVNGGSTAAAIDLGDDLPDNAVITRSWIDVISSASGSGTSIYLSTETAQDVLPYTAITSVTGGARIEGVSTGTAATMKKMSAARPVLLTISGSNGLTAGKFAVFIEYVVSH